MPLLLVMAWGISGFVPSSFVPSEDQGYFVATVSLPEASSMRRTEEVANKIAEEIRKMPGVKQTMIVTGIDMLADANKSSAAVIFTELTPWKERTAANLSVDSIVRNVIGMASRIPEANTMAFNVPPLPGIGSLGGFSFILQDRSGHTPQELDEATKAFLAEARKRPEIAMIYSTFRTDTPGYKFDVDREKAKKLGVPVSGVFNTLQAFLGGLQVNDFNRFGRTYKVVMQADAPYRQGVEDLRTLYVESNTGVMIPLSTLVQAVPVNNPTAFKRFNGFRSVLIGGSPAPGYSSGQVIQALEEVAAQSLPQGYSYEWADQSREEKVSGGRTPILFGLALLFVFLCLAALYESWTVPFAVLLTVPTTIFGAFLFMFMRGLENSVYMQIGLVMVIGLAAKNAILIVEFAVQRRHHGETLAMSAINAAKARLRPILMTSFAFIFGMLPLVFASGIGKVGNQSIGTGAAAGLLIGTFFGLIAIPVLYVIFQWLQEKIKPIKEKDINVAE